MERLKQVAKIFDNIGLGLLVAAIASLIREITDASGQVHLHNSPHESGTLVAFAILFYVACQIGAIWVLSWVDAEKS